MRTPYKKQHAAFTLIEIITVMIVLGLIAAVILVSTHSAKIRGTAAKTIEQLQVIETGLRDTYGNKEYFAGEEEVGFGSNPTVLALTTGGVLNDFFTVSSVATAASLGSYRYDNDRTTAEEDFYTDTDCTLDANDEKGVNIFIEDFFILNADVARQIDLLIDRGDGFGCGKVKRRGVTGTDLVYHLSDRYDRVE
jgi:prepilin-type N-terminal cleavage/methylation domain-containing protein